jgi:hypothetical protein
MATSFRHQPRNRILLLMISSLEHSGHRMPGVFPHETGIIFPFRNTGLQLSPPPATANADGSAGVACPCPLFPGRSADRVKIELTTYFHASLQQVYAEWINCHYLPLFMRPATAGPPAPGLPQLWTLRLRDEEVPWEAIAVEKLPCERITWWSTGRSSANRGCVNFDALGPRSTKVALTIEFYESAVWTVTEETARTLRTALDRGLDLLHASMTSGPVLAPAVATL